MFLIHTTLTLRLLHIQTKHIKNQLTQKEKRPPGFRSFGYIQELSKVLYMRKTFSHLFTYDG